MADRLDFLPVSKQDMEDREWWYYDFLVVTGDAYVDHPSFGAAVISRVLEAAGYRVAVLSQPDWHSSKAFAEMGRPRYAVMIGAGNLDSMVAHYTASRKRRGDDAYSPGRKAGRRPDHAVIVYANRAREAFPDLPVVIGGMEASLRRFAHYDYWEDKVRRSVLEDSGADLLVYGMGETATLAIAAELARARRPEEMRDIRGTAFLASDPSACVFPHVTCPSFEEVSRDKRAYAEANRIQYDEHDPVRGRAILQQSGDRWLVVNPPQMPLPTKEFDRISELPYARLPHPDYDAMGGVPAIEEVRFSIIHNRGCFGACNFCSLAFHQGRMITCRSEESVLREAELLTKLPDFKGYIHDVGGPTANFRHPSCAKQKKYGMCKGKNCLTPEPCGSLNADHSDYLRLLRRLREVPGVKKVFVRSGIRFDYLMLDRTEFFSELVRYHISGQLKVAPEHCIDSVLDYMGKPHNQVYERFQQKYARLNARFAKEQYLVPYLISSHPGSTLEDAVRLAEYLNRTGRQPEQVQDFYPTPGTLSTCMYYTGIDPRTMKAVYVARSPKEKAMQRALLQWKRPEKRGLVLEALRITGRTDLIGWGKECLIRPERRSEDRSGRKGEADDSSPRNRAGKKTRKPSKGKPTKRRR
ncbi:MAG: YgiQ family radical SAM protein [Oscillospiraceae bacterium]|nr:YgiQ family radical SAM protein [Oscillospiraceae bacterium]